MSTVAHQAEGEGRLAEFWNAPLATKVFWLLQIGVETVLYLSFAAGVARAGAWFRRPGIRARFEAVSGAVLVGLGVRVAVESP